MNEFTKDKPLKVFTTFSGYDSQCLALKKAGIPYDLIGWSEIEKRAIDAHNVLFPEYEDRNYGDICKINWEEVPDFDFFTYSSPCFLKDTYVLCKKDKYDEYFEYFKIQDIQVGWYVLTHTGETKRVLEVMKNPYKGLLYTIKSNYGDEVTCTPDHPFYIKRNDGYEWVGAANINICSDKCVTTLKDKWTGDYYFNDCDFDEIIITKTDGTSVYNLEVEDDHSYTANGFVVHNCQSFSIAGKKLGGEEGSGTKSSLLWECKKAIEIKRPKYLMLENVKNLVGKQFKHTFDKWLDFLSSLGYTSYWKVLNGADYGIPQARERVFVVSVLNPDGDFEWPRPQKQTKCMNDFLQKPSEIPTRCYVSKNCIEEYVKSNPHILKFSGETWDDNPVEINHKDTGKYHDVVKTGKQNKFVNQVVKDMDEEFDENLFGEVETDHKIDMYNRILQIGNIRTDRKTFPNPQSTRIYSPRGLAPTFTLVYAPLILVKENGEYKVREMTGVEEMRLIGVEYDDVQKLVDMGLTNEKLCKLAGNSIVVDVMSAFYKEMLKV